MDLLALSHVAHSDALLRYLARFIMHFDLTTSLSILATSLISPSILAYFINRSRRVDKKLDWEREDKVAKKAEEAAKLLLESNKQIAETAAQSHLETNQKLEVIRVDVNSNMTAAMKAELDATVDQLTLMHEVVALKKAQGIEPTKEIVARIAAKGERINELKATLKDRLTHSEAAAAAAEPLQT